MVLNIRDIARKAGVSVATISRAINPETRCKIAPKTLISVDALIRKYGYTPNLSARNLNKTSTKTIGVIFPYFSGLFYHSHYVNILAGVSDALLTTDYQFKTLLLRGEKEKWDHYDFKKGEHVDGLIIEHWPYFFSDKSILENMKIPCVVISDLRRNVKTFFACGDQIAGGRKVAEYLFGLGHRHFSVLTGLDTSTDSQLRLKGFCDYLKAKGVSLNGRWIIRADYREDMAYERVGEVFKERTRPTAVFCLNDQMAIGVLWKLKGLNIDCPKEVSVVGYDNEIRGQLCRPSLTSVNVPLYDLAAEGVRRIISHLKSPAAAKPLTGHVLYPVELIVRGSTQKASIK